MDPEQATQHVSQSPLFNGGWEAIVAWCIVGLIGFAYLCGFCYMKYLDCENHGNYNDWYRLRGWKYNASKPKPDKSELERDGTE